LMESAKIMADALWLNILLQKLYLGGSP